jgi:hypothetical protein
MNALLEWLSRLFGSWKFWVIVAPWEIGVRIRLGRVAATLQAGPHLRIPLLDEITLVSTRLRIGTTPPVTLPGTAGKVRTLTAVVGYRISDPVASLMRFAHPEASVLSAVQAELAAHANNGDCLRACRKSFDGSGVEVDFVRFSEDVEVRCFRLLNNSGAIWGSEGGAPTPVGGASRL